MSETETNNPESSGDDKRASGDADKVEKVEIEEIGPEENQVAKDEEAEILLPVPSEDDSNNEKKDDEKKNDEKKNDEKKNDEKKNDEKKNQDKDDDIIEIPRQPPPTASSSYAVLKSKNDSDTEGSEADSDESDDEDLDETLVERLIGLTEMFPPAVVDGSVTLTKKTFEMSKWVYSTGRLVCWVVFSSAAIMFLPIMIESERLGIEEMEKQQQRQILLGPGAAVSGTAAPGGASSPPLPSV